MNLHRKTVHYKEQLEQNKHNIKNTWKIRNSIIGQTHNKISIQDSFIIDGNEESDLLWAIRVIPSNVQTNSNLT